MWRGCQIFIGSQYRGRPDLEVKYSRAGEDGPAETLFPASPLNKITLLLHHEHLVLWFSSCTVTLCSEEPLLKNFWKRCEQLSVGPVVVYVWILLVNHKEGSCHNLDVM